MTKERLEELIEQEATVKIDGEVAKLSSPLGMFMAHEDGLFIGQYFTEEIDFVTELENIEEI